MIDSLRMPGDLPAQPLYKTSTVSAVLLHNGMHDELQPSGNWARENLKVEVPRFPRIVKRRFLAIQPEYGDMVAKSCRKIGRTSDRSDK